MGFIENVNIVATNVNLMSKMLLGNHATDPTTDNEGGPLLDGAMYFNTTDSIWKSYVVDEWLG